MRKGSGNAIPQAPFLSVRLSILSAQLIAELHVDVEVILFSVQENTHWGMIQTAQQEKQIIPCFILFIAIFGIKCMNEPFRGLMFYCAQGFYKRAI